LLLTLTAILSSLYCHYTLAAEESIVDNGSFELGLQGWETYSYGYGDAEVVHKVAYDGEYSLRTYTLPGPEVPKFPYGGGAYQTIERPDLTLDLKFSFWVRPGIVGENQYTQIRTWIEFHAREGQIFKLAYYIAWAFHVPENPRFNTTDTTYILIRDCKAGVWNRIERDLKSDFESRFGKASERSLSEIRLCADLAHYSILIIANAYWDTFTLTVTQTPQKYSSLGAIDDAYVSSLGPYINRGSDKELLLANYRSRDIDVKILVYIKFDLSNIPSNVEIISAKLELYSMRVTTPSQISIHHCAYNDWNEREITYANAPEYDTTPTVSTYVSGVNAWYSCDLKSDVRNAQGGQLSEVLEISFSSEPNHVSFYSKEASDSAYRPRLTIDHFIVEEKPPTPTLTPTATPTLTQTPTPTPTSTVTEAPGAQTPGGYLAIVSIIVVVIVIVAVFAFLFLTRSKRGGPKLLKPPAPIEPEVAPKEDEMKKLREEIERYDSLIGRLEELHQKGEIQEAPYRKLKLEYQTKLQKLKQELQ